MMKNRKYVRKRKKKKIECEKVYAGRDDEHHTPKMKTLEMMNNLYFRF